MPETIEWGQEPKEGMIPIGLSCYAVLEGKILKQQMIDLISKEKDLGFRKSVELFKQESHATTEESIKVVKQIKEDWNHKGKNFVLGKEYSYVINRVFWGYEKDIPANDSRYFKLNLVWADENKENEEKSFIENFKEIKAKSEQLSKKKKNFTIKESAEERKTETKDEF